jgi:hypothetical protein
MARRRSDKLIRYLEVVEPVLYVLGFAFGAYRGFEELRTAVTERAPTTIAMERFAADYRGQRWLTLQGRLALEHRQVQRSLHEAHEDRNLSYVRVPVVSPRWQPADPVRAVGVFGPFTPSCLDVWIRQRSGQGSVDAAVTGEAMTNVYDFGRLFPRLQAGGPIVYVNSDTRPSRPGVTLLWLGLCFVCIVLMIRHIRYIMRPDQR